MSFKIGDKVTFPAGNFGTITEVDENDDSDWVSVARLGSDNSGWWHSRVLRAGWIGKLPTAEGGLAWAVRDLRNCVSLYHADAVADDDRDGALAYSFVLDAIDERFEL